MQGKSSVTGVLNRNTDVRDRVKSRTDDFSLQLRWDKREITSRLRLDHFSIPQKMWLHLVDRIRLEECIDEHGENTALLRQGDVAVPTHSCSSHRVLDLPKDYSAHAFLHGIYFLLAKAR